MIEFARGYWRQWVRPTTLADRNIQYLVIQTAFAGIINGGITTFLPIYLVRLGASGLLVSLLTSSLALATIVMSLPSGPVVARQRELVLWSTRQFLIVRLAYAVIAAIALLPEGIAPVLTVIIWGLTGIPSAFANTAWYSVLAEAVPARRRPTVNGFRWALVGLVSAATVVLFGWLLDALPMPLGYQVVFLISFGAGLGQLWFYSRIRIPEQTPSAPRGSRSARQHLTAVVAPLRDGGEFLHYVIGTSVLRVGLYLPIGLYSVFWVNTLQASDSFIGLRTLVANGALTVGYYSWGRVAGRLGHRRTLAFAATGLALYPILTGVAPSVEWLIPAALIWGLFASGIDVSLFEGILEVCPPDRRSEFVALNTFLANVVALIVPILGAALATIFDIRFVLLLSGALHVASVGMVAYLARRSSTPDHRTPATQ